VDVDLARFHALTDFEAVARTVIEPASFDYIAGGSWDERTLAENEAAWSRIRLRPRVLVDVGAIAPATTLLGESVAMPVAVAPMAVHGLAHPDAEVGTARGAAEAGVPFTLSTMSSCSIEEVAAAVPDGIRWFQLYSQLEPSRTRELVERAARAGYRAIVLTVDLPRLGYRERDRRSSFELPRLGNFAEEGPTHRPMAAPDIDGGPLTLATLTWDDLAEMRSWSDLPFVVKGILTAEDAHLAIEHGVDAIVVSNHGARQLDRVGATADRLPEVLDAVGGRVEVWVDGGIRRGLDVATAVALGARGVLLGRPMLWALAAGGAAGVARALSILREEYEIALALLGAPSTADLRRSHVATPPDPNAT
jgi:4-hydroxymandelate oxidase